MTTGRAVRLGLLRAVGEITKGETILVAPVLQVGDLSLVVRLLKVVEGRLDCRDSGEEQNFPGLLVSVCIDGDIWVVEDVDNDLVWI